MTREKEINKEYKEYSSYSRLHNIWKLMKQRCFNKNATGYHNYGGRGITICKEWLDYNVFVNWAINNGYSDNLSIDRIDVNGNYEPNNCRFVNNIVQANNTRRNNKVYYKGELKTIAEVARISGINYRTLHNRITRGCWDIKDAINPNINGILESLGRKVEKCNIDGSHICYYDSIEDARRDCGCGRHISDVCLGKRKSCGGFVWKYAD